MGAHHCKVAGASKVFRKRKPTTSRRQSQTQAEKRFKEGKSITNFKFTYPRIAEFFLIFKKKWKNLIKFRKRKPTTSRRQSQTQAEKRFKEGEHNDFSDVDVFFFLNVKVIRILKTWMDYCKDLARS